MKWKSVITACAASPKRHGSLLLNGLSPECNRLLSVAAVIGRDFDLETLRRIGGLAEDELLVQAEKLLEIPSDTLAGALQAELASGEVVADLIDTRRCIFLAYLWRAERLIADRLKTLIQERPPWPTIDCERAGRMHGAPALRHQCAAEFLADAAERDGVDGGTVAGTKPGRSAKASERAPSSCPATRDNSAAGPPRSERCVTARAAESAALATKAGSPSASAQAQRAPASTADCDELAGNGRERSS